MAFRVSSQKLLIGSVLFLLLVAGVILRFSSSSMPVPPTPDGTNVPEFTSATFMDGDTLKGLGPEWTFLRQSPLESGDARALPGLTPDRESVVKLLGQPIEMTLSEYDIEDQKTLDLSLASHATSTVGTRTGYIVPLNDITGGEGLLLVGSRSALLVSLAGSAEWPITVPDPVVAFISAIRVP